MCLSLNGGFQPVSGGGNLVGLSENDRLQLVGGGRIPLCLSLNKCLQHVGGGGNLVGLSMNQRLKPVVRGGNPVYLSLNERFQPVGGGGNLVGLNVNEGWNMWVEEGYPVCSSLNEGLQQSCNKQFVVNSECLGFRFWRKNCVKYNKIETAARLRKSHFLPKCILFLPFGRC